MISPVRSVAWWILLAGLLSGCGGDSHPKTYPVTGKVVLKSGQKPAVGAIVTFHPKSPVGGPGQPNPSGTVKEDGSFVLTTFRGEDGAPEGEYGVTVRWPVQTKVGLGDAGGAGGDQLRGRYSDPATTRLTARVTADGPNQFVFELD